MHSFVLEFLGEYEGSKLLIGILPHSELLANGVFQPIDEYLHIGLCMDLEVFTVGATIIIHLTHHGQGIYWNMKLK